MIASCKTCKRIRVVFTTKDKFYECCLSKELSYPIVIRCECNNYEEKDYEVI